MRVEKTTEVMFTEDDVNNFLISKGIISKSQKICQIRILGNKKTFIVTYSETKNSKEDEHTIQTLNSEELELVLHRPIEEFDIDVRTIGALRKAGIYKLKDIYNKSEPELRKTYFVGKMRVTDIKKAFSNIGIKWPKN